MQSESAKKRKSTGPGYLTRSWDPTGLPSWASSENEELNAEKRSHAKELLSALLKLFVCLKISAKDLCVLCYHAYHAGLPNDDIHNFVGHPDWNSDRYQKRVDQAFGLKLPTYPVKTPVWNVDSKMRYAKAVAIRLPHRCLVEELAANPEIQFRAAEKEWSLSYYAHPTVVRHQMEGLPMPIPIALYLDAVRVGAPVAGRTDSTLGVWMYNLVSRKRHLLLSIRRLMLCRCGCRGWCSLCPLSTALAWSITSMNEGVNPRLTHDRLVWPVDHPLAELAGVALGYVAVVVQLKGDWGGVWPYPRYRRLEHVVQPVFLVQVHSRHDAHNAAVYFYGRVTLAHAVRCGLL